MVLFVNFALWHSIIFSKFINYIKGVSFNKIEVADQVKKKLNIFSENIIST